MGFLYQWIDIIWLVIAVALVQKDQRVLTGAFVVSCMVMMRMLVELMVSIEYETGILPMMESHVHDRALVVYSIFYILFLILVHYSPNSNKHVFVAASISVFFVASVTSILVMLL